MREWWDGISATEVPLACGESLHRLRWERGSLTAPDHADPDGERALAALGGERCACVEALDLWARHARDPAVLVLGPRGGGDRIREDPRAGQRMRGWWSYPSAPGPGAEPETVTLQDLLRGGLGRRLVAGVLAADVASPAELQAALYGRFLATLAVWQDDRARLELEVVDPAAPPSLTRGPDGAFRARLPLSWLLDVWVREREIGFGYLTLGLHGGDELEVVDGALRPHRLAMRVTSR
jgi:hypothetical protein